ncbi:disintegrin and metalloproteinase domain-containing protein 10 isoform X2 [Parasteatoda tepidariorum]|uniref:disintegrin and metalloproteinase domain-containing protein 10 isoform X2 n=1 Tax=Parasteatoda tepidariorum TaxID=114398 RepID=UPI001C725F92|nr:disintegrin and metalloproteinase domain-containing protein 10 isoform X2 [Parasteatoda tepidariorum]
MLISWPVLFIPFVFLTFCAAICMSMKQGLGLNPFILHFEPLFYSQKQLNEQNYRSKRSPKSEIRLQFTAHNKVFKLRMKSESSIFASDVLFESSSRGIFDYDMNKVLKGHLDDDEDSSVEGVITSNGLLDAVVNTKREQYFIEPSSRYFPDSHQLFHSVIYRLSDVHFPLGNITHKSPSSVHKHDKSPFLHHHITSSSDLPHSVVHKNRKDNSSLEFPLFLKLSSKFHFRHLKNKTHHIRTNYHSRTLLSSKTYEDILYWRDGDSLHYRNFERYGDSERYGVRSNQRTHWSEDRTDRHIAIDPQKSTCMLYLQADHLFYQKMGSEEACIETMTRHVQKVNGIYKNTDFDQDGRPDNISFLIKRIKVHTSDALKDPVYRFPGNYGVEKFLELFSEEDYDAFCLAYMFTYRDFEGGTLGLAWTGDLKNAGGVCEKNGHYRGSLKSLNTGIVTLLNYGKYVPPIVSHVTLAHEIGHNFGSPHDPEDDVVCTPGGDNGNYIMFARATSGDKRNNNKFSPCSVRSINAVLNTKARSLKGCFTEIQDSICGNGVVEKSEQCDCGWEEDCEESCCFPMRTNPPRDEPPCMLRPNVICSPSQGPCCSHDCSLKIGEECRGDNGCRSPSYCDGKGPQCPPSTNKPNKTVCNEEFVCYMGECTGSICVAYGLESCQCRRGPRDPATKACELCCKLPGDDYSCKSSFDWNFAPYDVPDLYAKPGTPCDNYNGYCDVFQKCREVDPSGPLATLRKLFLSNESMASVKRWILLHWWVVLLLVILIIMFMIIIVRLFGKQSDPVKSVSENGQVNKSISLLRPCSNQPLVKARTQALAASSSIALAHASNHQKSTSNFVRTSVSSFTQKHRPLLMTGNGWV